MILLELRNIFDLLAKIILKKISKFYDTHEILYKFMVKIESIFESLKKKAFVEDQRRTYKPA